MPSLVAVPALAEAEDSVLTGVPDEYRHYFNGRPPVPFTKRHWEFSGEPASIPLARAFLDTCAATRDSDFRYVFALLGTELATNAIRHSRSGEEGQTFVLRVARNVTGLTLVCRDNGTPARSLGGGDGPLVPVPPTGDRLTAENGRGLALVDSFATTWGDNGHPSIRKVWFHLAYDMTGSSWPAA
ncbi:MULTISPECIES: ATP-binding protein [Nocardiopsis]|uniref:ATP-binding protein n=1 Tax=Nocardiopsis lambiniae TaxID=3075539 RepID=A0ABU2M515_9ACTN|nr:MULTISPECIES: ATP-binding protein [unclassified Nocardiopsis]MDE3721522.1 ATP-binding protein [Nocardiopsis sp. N85]MDT0327722.1 ATP-binding protein [Nocardiopsis sp. DSM 44743]